MCSSLCCLSSCSYIKPQLDLLIQKDSAVVYHLVPTSNHNRWRRYALLEGVVYHLVPTSNHNFREQAVGHRALFIILFLHQTTTLWVLLPPWLLLFIILFLHQTTTSRWVKKVSGLLFIILFLHQTTTLATVLLMVIGCLSSCSYIKPQLQERGGQSDSVVYHLVPTSNHNGAEAVLGELGLFIILFLHQTTTMETTRSLWMCCLSSCSYIKPQQNHARALPIGVVYHLVPTSNHNTLQ